MATLRPRPAAPVSMALAPSAARQVRRREEERALIEQAIADPLSRLGNRAAYEAACIRKEGDRERGERGAVLFIDIDFFKRINDEKGHAAGDRAISEFGKSIRSTIRTNDEAFRYGGDEFVIILKNMTRASAELFISKRLRPAFERIGISASIGMAEYGKERSIREAIRHADDKVKVLKESRR